MQNSGNFLHSNPSDTHNTVGLASNMSLPRRAMEQMGFSICCLLCDAPDITGTKRCKECIYRHTRARERLTTGKARTKAQRLARELVTMLSDPFSYTEDDDHGKHMQEYSELIQEHQFNPKKGEDHRNSHRHRISRKKSLIREVANQNRWAVNPPKETEIDQMREILRDGEERHPMTWDDLIEEIEDLLED